MPSVGLSASAFVGCGWGIYNNHELQNMSGDGIFGDFIASFRKSAEEQDAVTEKAFVVPLTNAQALTEEFRAPDRTTAGKWSRLYAWHTATGYQPGYYVDSMGVGTVASEKNSLDSYIFWTEQELLKSQGKPYVSGK